VRAGAHRWLNAPSALTTFSLRAAKSGGTRSWRSMRHYHRLHCPTKMGAGRLRLRYLAPSVMQQQPSYCQWKTQRTRVLYACKISSMKPLSRYRWVKCQDASSTSILFIEKWSSKAIRSAFMISRALRVSDQSFRQLPRFRIVHHSGAISLNSLMTILLT
jgi:hypothetical protein